MLLKKLFFIGPVLLLATASTLGAAPGVAANVFLDSSDELSEAETESLLFIYEEEKLARDVYIYLYSVWGTSIFDTISISEQTHMDSVQNLLVKYALPIPETGVNGVFYNPELQALYDWLTNWGLLSLGDALKVGAYIEEFDMLDLQVHRDETDNEDIQQVYDRLRNGSENHLRAFVRTLLLQTGEVYEPVFLTDEHYDAIINYDSDSGGGEDGEPGDNDDGGEGGNNGNGNGQTGGQNRRGQAPKAPALLK